MPEPGSSFDEFICAILELAAGDCSLGWRTAMRNVAGLYATQLPPAVANGVTPDAAVALGLCGTGEMVDGRLNGRWRSVVGVDRADWLLLSAPRRHLVLVRSDAVRVELSDREQGLAAAGIGDVVVADAPIDGDHVVATDRDAGLVAGVGAAAAVVGSADRVWRCHVDRVRARLTVSYGGDDVTDEAAAHVARAASDIDAAKLHVRTSLESVDGEGTRRALTQAIARARGAADRLLASSRHALDASDAVAEAWRDVHAGRRLAREILDSSV